jgi:hypothetical protein
LLNDGNWISRCSQATTAPFVFLRRRNRISKESLPHRARRCDGLDVVGSLFRLGADLAKTGQPYNWRVRLRCRITSGSGTIMPCTHIKHLYDYCRTHDLKLSSSDLIRIVCPQCGVEEVCPSLLAAEYAARHPDSEAMAPAEDKSERE